MMPEVDEEFYDRADAHILLANDTISETVGRGKVSSSFLYAASRFNAWVSACGWSNSGEMAEAKQETMDYFVNEYRKMLDENLQDYIDNFDEYMQINTTQENKE